MDCAAAAQQLMSKERAKDYILQPYVGLDDLGWGGAAQESQLAPGPQQQQDHNFLQQQQQQQQQQQGAGLPHAPEEARFFNVADSAITASLQPLATLVPDLLEHLQEAHTQLVADK
jgi:hypothetical protein